MGEQTPDFQVDSALADSNSVQGVVRRTSIHIESAPSNPLETKVFGLWQGDGYHECYAFAEFAGTRGNDKSKLRTILTKWTIHSGGDSDSRSDQYVSPPKTTPRQGIQGLETAANLKAWTGGGQPAEAWGKLRQDPDLWDPEGNVLVYLGHKYPEPSFRIHSWLLEESHSLFLLHLLRDGNRNSQADDYSVGSGSTSHYSTNSGTDGLLPTEKLSIGDSEMRRIYLDAPSSISKMDILRHHVTTRNFFALLLNKPIVGYTYYQALVDLYERLQAYLLPSVDCAGLLITYLTINHLNDTRNDPGAAAGMLAWSEEANVSWAGGWREGFVHSVGMYTSLIKLPENRDISTESRTLLDHSHLELQTRVEAAQDSLTGFFFGGGWLAANVLSPSVSHACGRFGSFLQEYFLSILKSWPIRAHRRKGRPPFTRTMVMRMQQDLGTLYDLCVDKNISSTEMDLLFLRQQQADELNTTPKLRESCNDDQLRSMIVSFDREHAFTHLPFPWPLLPASSSTAHTAPGAAPLSTLRKKLLRTDKRSSHAYVPASKEPSSTSAGADDLVSAFNRFEESEQASETNPRDSRIGRWIVLYCALQVLATVSVDTPGLWYKEVVEYFLSPHLKETTPLKTFTEASREQSYCWKTGEG